jgi:hypothetical protein
LERREVEKRIYGGEELRLTASAALHGYTITPDFEQQITDILTNNDQFVNNAPTFVLIRSTRNNREGNYLPGYCVCFG